MYYLLGLEIGLAVLLEDSLNGTVLDKILKNLVDLCCIRIYLRIGNEKTLSKISILKISKSAIFKFGFLFRLGIILGTEFF